MRWREVLGSRQHDRGRPRESPLHAVWLVREQPAFEEARQWVVTIMVRVLSEQPSPLCVLAEVLELTEPA
jgi:hypothetical protein